MKVFWSVIFLWAMGSAAGSAAEPGASPSNAAPEPSVRAKIRTTKGNTRREKEAEGSEARNRFQVDTVLKSKYELNGQSLEVDPD